MCEMVSFEAGFYAGKQPKILLPFCYCCVRRKEPNVEKTESVLKRQHGSKR